MSLRIGGESRHLVLMAREDLPYAEAQDIVFSMPVFSGDMNTCRPSPFETRASVGGDHIRPLPAQPPEHAECVVYHLIAAETETVIDRVGIVRALDPAML